MSLYQKSPLALALVRRMPQSFISALQQSPVAIDAAKAQAQHEAYTELLRSEVKLVVQLPADESLPDCCFIEDTALIRGRDAVITTIGAEPRVPESAATRQALETLNAEGWDFKLHALSAAATLDGGDVLQMGGLVFVGLSKRTNFAAYRDLSALWPKQVFSVPVPEGLHLKSLVSALDDKTLLAGASQAAKAAAEVILSAFAVDAEVELVTVPDIEAANVLRLGSLVVIQAGFPKSEAIVREASMQRGLRVQALLMSELIKADGALTCCSLLIP